MSRTSGSVVIPAHDEVDQIGATLDTLLADADDHEFEVIVLCNGCSDDTAAIARQRPAVRVEELATPSKVAALRHGDTIATTFPRIYLDGDVELTTAAARELVAVLATEAPRVAGVVGRVDTTGTSRPAQWYFDFRQRLPVFAHGIIGAGAYAMNEAGHGRLGTWPRVTADDQFVLRLFSEHERITVPGHHTHVRAPADLATLVRRQVRVRRGNVELATSGHDHGHLDAPPAGIGAALRDAVATPSAWPGVVTWIGVNAAVRVLARLPTRGDWS